LDPARLVFIDDSAAKTNMTRLRGRAPRGERLLSSSPHGHWQTTTMISSVRLDGSTACMTIDGATNTEVFYAYVRSILCPTLRPGDIVIMDNLGAHKNKRTAALIKAAGAHLRFLPAYSPDLNPIENDVEQSKSSAPCGRGQKPARPPSRHRPRPTRRHATRRPRLVYRLRLQFYLKSSKSGLEPPNIPTTS
jgi:transposase